jgi:hypothetical protein
MLQPLPKPQLSQYLFRFFLRLALVHPLDEPGHHGIFQGAEFGEEVMELEDKADVPIAHLGQLSVGAAEKILPLKEHFPFRRPV